MLRRGSVNYVLLSILLDVVVTLVALSAAALLRVWLPLDERDLLSVDLPPLVVGATTLMWVLVFNIFAVYDEQRNYRAVDELQRVVAASLVALLVMAGMLYFSYRDVPRLFVVYFAMVNILLLVGWRLAARWVFRLFRSTYNQRNVVVVGANELGRKVADMVEQYSWCGLNFVGYIDNRGDDTTISGSHLGPMSGLSKIVQEHNVKEVVVALPYDRYGDLSSLVYELQPLPVQVRVVPNYLNLALHHATIENFSGLPLINLREPALTGYQRMAKRIFDVVVSAILILLTLPTMVAVAIAVKLDSPGPVLFKQKRIGENGKPFQMYKFRSMVADAEKLQSNVNTTNASGQLIHKRVDDPRITRVGHIIRKTSLDELPQLFNVLFGDMSLVGPRPELPWLVAQYEPWQHKRFAVPQGITGWWQVNGRSTKPLHLSTEEDLYYIQNYSLLLDLQILWKTVAVVLKREGAF